MSREKFYTPIIVSFIHEMHAIILPLYGFLRAENRDGVFVHRTRALSDALGAILDEARELPDTERADLDFHNSSFPKLREIAQELNEIAEEVIQAETTPEDIRGVANDVERFLRNTLILDGPTMGYRRTARASLACFEECKMSVILDPYGALGIVTRILYHDPCWVGILEPVPAFEGQREEILTELKVDDLDIQIEDLVSGETWAGRLSDVVLPETEYPWHELLWRDERKPYGGSVFSAGALTKL